MNIIAHIHQQYASKTAARTTHTEHKLRSVPAEKRELQRTMSGSDADDDLEEVELEHGIRRSRRLTNFSRRESSALYPAQMMEAEVHYNFAENAAFDSFYILEMLLLLLPLHQRLSNLMASWQQIQGISRHPLKLNY